MVLTRIIPCLDVSNGRVVKGVRFQGLRDAGDPVQQARSYQAQGADELVLLDISATPSGRRHGLDTVAAVREVLPVPLTVGGGVRTADDVARLLEVGADKVGINTAAVRDPSLVTRTSDRFGAQCIVVAVDAVRTEAQRWEIVVTSGAERITRDAVDWCREVAERGAGEILLTSLDRDGTREGYDLELLAAVRDAVRVPVIASGGASNPAHLVDAARVGADAVLAASIFHEGEYTVTQVKDFMAARGVEVRR